MAKAVPYLGCIVVTEAGDLKELQIGFDMEAMGGLGANNPAATRDETLADVNLSPRDRLILLHNGLRAISRLLEERQRPAAPGDAARADV